MSLIVPLCPSPRCPSRLLCQCGLDVSAVDVDGWTPLHAASHWGQGEACRILAEHLCDMEARSSAVRLTDWDGGGVFVPCCIYIFIIYNLKGFTDLRFV